MEDAFLTELLAHTKVTFYVLPLLCMNKFSFDDKFVDSYINREGTHLCVGLRKGTEMSLDVLGNPYLRFIDTRPDESVEVWFRIPVDFWSDVQLFIGGHYGDFSEEAKSMIRAYSGLGYRVPDEEGEGVVTDYRLLALDRSVHLRHKWESLYKLTPDVITKGMDLIDPPGERDFKPFRS